MVLCSRGLVQNLSKSGVKAAAAAHANVTKGGETPEGP